MARMIGLRKHFHNDYGTGVDGTQTYSTNQSFSSTSDGPIVYKQYVDLTVNSGVTVTVSNRCEAFFIYCRGSINNSGTITMSLRGPNLASPSDGVFIRYYALNGSVRGLPATFKVPASGGAGGAAVSTDANGNAGGTTSNGTGGGGSGGHRGSGSSASGGAGTCWSGGSASGGSISNASPDAPGANAGQGGDGDAVSQRTGGGAGNPGGSAAGSGGSGGVPDNGNGGFLNISVKSNFTNGATGVISCNGGTVTAVVGTATSAVNGGASGGGINRTTYGDTLSNTGSIVASGGVTPTASGATFNRSGGAGGAGTQSGPTKIAA